MKIGIIGAGHIGGTVGTLWAQHGHEVMLSSRHPEGLDSLIQLIGPKGRKGTVEQVADFGEVVFLAIPLGEIPRVATSITKSIAGKVVLDAMNPFVERDGGVAEEILLRGITAGQASQERFPASRIVRAFSSVRYGDLQAQANRNTPTVVAIPFATDDPGAREIAVRLIRDAGFEPFDIGSLAESKVQDPGGILFGKALTSDRGTARTAAGLKPGVR